MSRRIGALVAMVVLLGGCSGVGTASPTSSAGASGAVGVPATSAPIASASASAALATNRPTPKPVPTALPRPNDLPTDGTCDPDHTCLGLLRPGKYHTKVFIPAFAFTIPAAGWENLAEAGGNFDLTSVTEPGDVIQFGWRPRPTKADGTPVLGVRSTVADVGAWLAKDPDIVLSSPGAVTVGGLKGMRWDVAVAPTATTRTNGCPTTACVTFLRGNDPSQKPTWEWDFGVASSERERVYLLSGPKDMTAIIVDSYDGTTFANLARTADQILGTVAFDAP
jgi:hypothetical protein